jgi:hypothetical protein
MYAGRELRRRDGWADARESAGRPGQRDGGERASAVLDPLGPRTLSVGSEIAALASASSSRPACRATRSGTPVQLIARKGPGGPPRGCVERARGGPDPSAHIWVDRRAKIRRARWARRCFRWVGVKRTGRRRARSMRVAAVPPRSMRAVRGFDRHRAWSRRLPAAVSRCRVRRARFRRRGRRLGRGREGRAW